MAKFELISTVDVEINKLKKFNTIFWKHFQKCKQYYINRDSSELSNNYIKPVKDETVIKNWNIQNMQKYAVTKFRKCFRKWGNNISSVLSFF